MRTQKVCQPTEEMNLDDPCLHTTCGVVRDLHLHALPEPQELGPQRDLVELLAIGSDAADHSKNSSARLCPTHSEDAEQ
jgi:hypothetical protein